MRMCGVGLNNKVKDKTMITFDEKKYPQITDAEIKDALQFSTEQVIRDLPEFTEKFQKAYSENGFYQPIPNNYWTCGFWTGEIWLAYEYSQDERLKKMLTWMHRNLDKTISVSEIANTANICLRECQRIFQQYLHYSPIEYLQRIRIFHAAKLLTDSDAPITEIALNCGFSNPSYFSKQFKTIMGSRPREYRAASHKEISTY